MKTIRMFAFGSIMALAASIGFGGVICQWNSSVERGNWSDAANWVDGVIPGPEDAASFLLDPGISVTVDFPEELGALSVTNLWIKGGGTVTFQMPEPVSMIVTATVNNSESGTLGAGRDAMAIRGGSTFVLTGGGTISNLQSQVNKPYNQLQMSDINSRLFVTGGSKFKFAARIPVNGAANASGSDTKHGNTEIHVDGEGSEATFYANISGIGTHIYAENGGTFNAPVFSLNGGSPKGYAITVTNHAHLALSVSGTTLLSGSPATYLIDDSSTANIGQTEFISANDTTFTIAGGSLLTAQKLSPGYKDCQNMTVLITNATAKVAQYLRIGASQAGLSSNLGNVALYGSTNTTLRIAAGGKLEVAETVINPLTVGWTSTADTLFVDGGELVSLSTQDMVIAYTNCVDATLKVRGETAAIDLAGNLKFQLGGETYGTTGTTLAVELPLSGDRAAIRAQGAVTIAPGTKLRVTVPKDVLGRYRLLEAASIEGGFTEDNIEVDGNAKVTVIQDATSIILQASKNGLCIILH